MTASGDAAEQVVRMSLEGVEVAAKISGTGAKNIALLLAAVLKEEQKTKGKARLSSMLKSGKELKVFSVRQQDLKKFSQEAKRYGVLFCVVKEKKPRPDALSDILVKAEDAAKINRIIERLGLGQVDILNNAPQVVELSADEQAAQHADEILDQIIKEPAPDREEDGENPLPAQTELSPQSEPSFAPSVADFDFSFPDDATEIGVIHLDESVIPMEPEQRSSVRAALAQIRQQQYSAGVIAQRDLTVDQQLEAILGNSSTGITR